jgi:asparagine synthase (glutamine-hydrolysing)
MLTRLRHRGPDDDGIETIDTGTGHLALGFRRLAIIDLSPAGHQPMRDQLNNNVTVFNGEIYNFKTLRGELEALGESDWLSSSDTEVLLKSYRRWGEKCLERLRGMFAFAVWDTQLRRLMLARDRLGIKPLYYYQSGNEFVFASELRALLASGIVPREPCAEAIGSYLELGAVQEPLTMIEGVKSLGAGQIATLTAGQYQQRYYWDLNALRADGVHDHRDAQHRLREILEESVRLHLNADVPVGIFLSGGLDSSALVALGRRVFSGELRTLSLVFSEHEYSEERYSRLVARTFATEHSEVRLSPVEMLGELDRAVDAADQPTVDGINTYMIARTAAQQGLKVVLSGLGGDELFGGYPSFVWAPRLKRLMRVPVSVRRPLAGLASRLFTLNDRWAKTTRLASSAGGNPYFAIRELFGPDARQGLVPDFQFSADRNGSTALDLKDSVNQISRLELSYYMRNMLLRDSDSMSMAHSLELRVPLLDDALVEFALTVPGNIKLNGHGVKPLLAGALSDILPEPVRRRHKAGFTLPWQPWLHGPLASCVESMLLNRERGGKVGKIMDADAVSEVWRRFRSGNGHWTRPWALYTLKKWGERNLSETPSEDVRRPYTAA